MTSQYETNYDNHYNIRQEKTIQQTPNTCKTRQDRRYHTIQCKAMQYIFKQWQYETRLHNARQDNTTHYKPKQDNMIQYKTVQHYVEADNTIYYTTLKDSTRQDKTRQDNTKQNNTIQHGKTQHNMIQYKTT